MGLERRQKSLESSIEKSDHNDLRTIHNLLININIY